MCLHDGHRAGPGQETRFGHQAPPTDRGAEITAEARGTTIDVPQVAIHWVSGTLPDVHINDLLDELAERCGVTRSEFAENEHGWNTYRRSWRGPWGVVVAYDRAKGGAGGNDAAPREAFVAIPGKACEALGTEKLREWIKRLPKATRIDLALDVPKGEVPAPRDLRAAWKASRESFRTAAKAGAYHEEDGEEGVGETFVVGRRSSERYLRVYSRREGVVRFELESKADQAQACKALLGSWGGFVNIVVGKLRAYCDFVTPSSNVSRSELAEWWHSVVQNYARIREAAAVVVETLEGKAEWFREMIGTTLDALLEWSGGDLGRFIPDDARTRRSPRLQRLLRDAAIAARASGPGASLQPVPS